MFLRSHFLLLLGALVLSACHRQPATPAAASAPSGDILVDLEPVAQGRRMKVAWVQSARAETADVMASGHDLRLMGLDSANSQGVHPLRAEIGSYFRPLISGNGAHVIYTDRSATPTIAMLDWDTGHPQMLGAGVAVALWTEPGSRKEWIYGLEEIDQGAREGLIGKRLVRFLPNTPTDREIIWTQTPVDADGFQLSRDGLRASGLLPAPEASRLNLAEHTSQQLTAGAWPGLAPDNSYLAWTLAADDATLQFYTPNHSDPWLLPLNTLPEIGQAHAIWHPRWGNDVSLITFSGPYAQAPNQPSFQNAQGVDAEIFIARLADNVAQLWNVVQITHNDRGDAYPDVWLENAAEQTLVNFPQSPPEAAPTPRLPWPTHPEALQFCFTDAATETPLPLSDGSTRRSRLQSQQSARLGPHWEMDVSRGYATADETSNTSMAKSCQASGAFTLEAIFSEQRSVPYDQPLSVRLAGCTRADGSEALGLYRVENSLVLRLRLGPQEGRVYPVRLATFRIAGERPYHCAVSFDGTNVRAYLDGNPVSDTTMEASGLTSWTPGQWTWGDPAPLTDGLWSGSVDHTALYSRALSGEEIADHFQAVQPILANRKPPDRLKLQAVLESVTPLPTDPAQSPYPRILTSRTYRVQSVDAGVYAAQYIVVLHDAALNRHAVPGLPEQLGNPITLFVEPASQHPELRAAQIVNETTLTTLPLYLEVSPLTTR